MTSQATSESYTVFPDQDESGAEIIDFAKHLAMRGVTPRVRPPQLVSSNGERIDLPEQIYQVLVLAAETLQAGRAFTVAPRDTQLTTQEAADFLGISRPTLVKLLDSDEMPCTKVGRHRRVVLAELLAYKERLQSRRSAALDEMVALAQDDDLYEKTAMPAEGVR